MAERSVPPVPTPPLAGREREQRQLRDALASTLAGRGSLVLIGGEAGIGKTALAEAICAEATVQGTLVLVGRCYDLAETPPYGPWAEALARAPHGNGLPALPTALLPPERDDGEALASQDAIIRRVQAYLVALAAAQPLVLLLDDLHWADPASRDLLRAVARDLAALPLLLLATYRAEDVDRDHPLHTLLPLLVREARAERLDLRPLDATATDTLVGARYALGEGDRTRLVAYLAGRTEGNALFLGELLRTLEGEGTLHRTGNGWQLGDLEQVPVPTLLRQVIEGRVARLDRETARLLAVAAIVGQEVPLRVWAAVGGVRADDLLDHAERAVEARLLSEAPDGAGVRFAHALIRETLYEATSALRRRALHRQAAEALIASPQPDPDAVAYHLQRAGDPRAATWLVRAGERAARSYAWLTAAARYEAALTVADQAGIAPADRASLLLTLAQFWRYEDHLRGVTYLEKAEKLAEAAGDAALLAAVRFDRGHLRLLANDAQAVIERPAGLAAMAAALPALEALAPADRAQLPALRLQRAGGDELFHRGALLYWLVFVGRLSEALALAAPMIERRPGTPARGLAALGLAYFALGRPAEAERALTESQDIFHAAGQQAEVIYRLIERLQLVATYYLDQSARWQPLLAELADATRRAADTWRIAPDALLPWLAFVRGDWAQVGSDGAGHADSDWTWAAIARHRGSSALAQTAVARYLPHGPATEPGGHALLSAPQFQRLATDLALDAGNLPLARIWLEAHDRWLGWSGAVLGQAEGQLGWSAYHRAAGDVATAREHAERALAHASAPRQPLALLAAHRALGELDTATKRHTDAHAHLDAALALADACAAPYERALTLLALAELHIAEGRSGEATTTMIEARTTFASLGAAPALARADALAARLAVPAPTPTREALPFGLTAREAEVLRLVALGLGNADIADRLSLSRRTVEQHLRNAYDKLGVDNRTAATRIAVERGLA